MTSSDSAFFSGALITLYAAALINLLSLPFITAPYGRHFRPKWGPSLPAPLAWSLMESPTLFLPPLLLFFIFPSDNQFHNPLSLLLLSLFLLHYSHRTLIFPLRLLKSKKNSPFPLSIALCAFLFNLLNAYLQTRSLAQYHPPNPNWVRVFVGVGIFSWGMWVNVRSDLELVRLKREEGGGYRIPRGGWFEWVCCPNYMGEAMEWLGWAVVAWSPAALGFFVYTCSNLVPRARANLRWSRDKFGAEWPVGRKAIVPILY